MFAFHEWWVFAVPKPGNRQEHHVIPMNDLRPHDADRTCWCRPAEDDDQPTLWVHNALDQRDAYERGELLTH